MSTELITQIFELCIIPLLAALTVYFVKFLHTKSEDISNKTNDATAKKYVSLIESTITRCVIATNQTYVETLKQQGKFDLEAQKVAFEKTYNAVLGVLSEDAKIYIQETAGDLTIYLTQLIEAEVNKNKVSTSSYK